MLDVLFGEVVLLVAQPALLLLELLDVLLSQVLLNDFLTPEVDHLGLYLAYELLEGLPLACLVQGGH